MWKLVHTHQSPFTGAMITDKQQQRFDIVMKNIAQLTGSMTSSTP